MEGGRVRGRPGRWRAARQLAPDGRATSRSDDARAIPAAWVAPLAFAACYAYAPAGETSGCRGSRALALRLKRADPLGLAELSVEVWRQVRGGGRFAAFFRADTVLVPVPGSAAEPGARWVGQQLAGCLSELGLGQSVQSLLRRRHAVRKSATSPAGLRPTVMDHYASFAVRCVRTGCGPPSRLVLVDDVITRGRTLLAGAARLREAFPRAEILAFALLRTLAPGEAVRANPDPREGLVWWARGDARRSP